MCAVTDIENHVEKEARAGHRRTECVHLAVRSGVAGARRLREPP